MKKLLLLLTMVALCFTLWSCATGGNNTACTTHTDSDSNLRCDNCGAELECPGHVDEDTDIHCDLCDEELECPGHIDEDTDLYCDLCDEELECENHIDQDPNDGECDLCGEHVPCPDKHVDSADMDLSCDICGEDLDCDEHVDANSNLECDECEAKISCINHIDTNEDLSCDNCKKGLDCKEHKDADGNLECDKCGEELECVEHVDANVDLKCDKCGADIPCVHSDANNDGICDVEACKWNYDHEHTYATEWTTSETEHWHVPTCNHTIPDANRAAHEDNDNNGICDVCAYVSCEHTEIDETTWASDDSGHWRPAACGHTFKPDASKITAHEYDAEGLCVCGYKDTHTHTFESDWSFTATEHYYKSTCGHTTVEKDRGAHVDENNDGVCETCEKQFCNHTFEDAWTHDDDSHWHKSTCGHEVKGDEAEHSDENNDGVCEECTWDFDHEHTYEWVYDQTSHKLQATCEHTLPDTNEGTHVDSNGDSLCDFCPWNYGHDHEYEEEWTTNETHHWHKATCSHDNVKGNYEKHTDIDGNFKCDTCQVFYEDFDNIPETGGTVIVTPPHIIGGNKNNG